METYDPFIDLSTIRKGKDENISRYCFVMRKTQWEIQQHLAYIVMFGTAMREARNVLKLPYKDMGGGSIVWSSADPQPPLHKQ